MDASDLVRLLRCLGPTNKSEVHRSNQCYSRKVPVGVGEGAMDPDLRKNYVSLAIPVDTRTGYSHG